MSCSTCETWAAESLVPRQHELDVVVLGRLGLGVLGDGNGQPRRFRARALKAILTVPPSPSPPPSSLGALPIVFWPDVGRIVVVIARSRRRRWSSRAGGASPPQRRCCRRLKLGVPLLLSSRSASRRWMAAAAEDDTRPWSLAGLGGHVEDVSRLNQADVMTPKGAGDRGPAPGDSGAADEPRGGRRAREAARAGEALPGARQHTAAMPTQSRTSRRRCRRSRRA